MNTKQTLNYNFPCLYSSKRRACPEFREVARFTRDGAVDLFILVEIFKKQRLVVLRISSKPIIFKTKKWHHSTTKDI